jgi:diguanylate cyclase (GGDEF)-like protein
MDLEKLETIALKLQGEFLISEASSLLDRDPILKAKLLDILKNATDMIPDHKTLFNKLAEDIQNRYVFLTMKGGADICKDIYEYALLMENPKQDSNAPQKDPITDLYDIRKINTVEFTKFKTVSIAFLDVDNFKGVNSKHGHSGGDAVLKRIAQILKELETQGAFVLRNYGSRGDEFSVVLFNITKDAAFNLIENYRKKITENLKKDFNVTMSVGIASYPEDARDMEELKILVDRALQFSKENGKNTSTKYEPRLEQETTDIQFNIKDILNIQKGSHILVKSWKCHNPPNISNLEAIELMDTDNDILYTSRNKGVVTTVQIMNTDIRGVVTEVSRPPGETLFKLRVRKIQLNDISTDPKDFFHPFVR